MHNIASIGPVTCLVIGCVGFVAATLIDHELGISCPELHKIDVAGWKLLLHKFIYVAVGAGTMFLFLHQNS